MPLYSDHVISDAVLTACMRSHCHSNLQIIVYTRESKKNRTPYSCP